MPVEKTFQISRAADLAGLSVPMVDYLCRTGVVHPSASQRRVRGKVRRFTFADLVLLRTLAALLSRGISVARIKEALKTLRRRYPVSSEDVLAERYLVTDGKWVFFKGKNAPLEEVNRGGQFAFSLCSGHRNDS